MRSQTSLSLGSLVLLAAMPLAWLACGGGKPPETPADESSSENSEGSGSSASDSSSAAPSDSSAPASSAAGGGDMSPDNSAPGSSGASAAASPPPAPAFGDSDCGKCVDKTCAKPLAACGKNPDCQSVVDAIHSCGSDKGASACIGSGSTPTGAKPKKLLGAYAKCATKASSGKACKASCQ
ncbi:MAG TPA: hypothetical protein VMI75_29330 [Polyangiaceae bacterium]|nr:hypothetical protein [Polyangiaceae bacterium]